MSTINEDLLAAAKELVKFVKTAPGRLPERVTVAFDAIAAAERELAERKRPIDEEWLRQFGCDLIDGAWFVKHQQIILSDDKWYAIHLGPLVILNSKGQLLDLLSGLVIEVRR